MKGLSRVVAWWASRRQAAQVRARIRDVAQARTRWENSPAYRRAFPSMTKDWLDARSKDGR